MPPKDAPLKKNTSKKFDNKKPAEFELLFNNIYDKDEELGRNSKPNVMYPKTLDELKNKLETMEDTKTFDKGRKRTVKFLSDVQDLKVEEVKALTICIINVINVIQTCRPKTIKQDTFSFSYKARVDWGGIILAALDRESSFSSCFVVLVPSSLASPTPVLLSSKRYAAFFKKFRIG